MSMPARPLRRPSVVWVPSCLSSDVSAVGPHPSVAVDHQASPARTLHTHRSGSAPNTVFDLCMASPAVCRKAHAPTWGHDPHRRDAPCGYLVRHGLPALTASLPAARAHFTSLNLSRGAGSGRRPVTLIEKERTICRAATSARNLGSQGSTRIPPVAPHLLACTRQRQDI